MELTDDERRVAVLKAACAVFSVHGFARGQITSIASASHVSTATLYKLFPSKEHLFAAAYDFALQRMSGFASESLRIGQPLAALRHVARRYAALLNDVTTRQVVRMQIAQNAISAGKGRVMGNKMREHVEAAFGPALDRCVEGGLILQDNRHKAHALIVGMIAHQTLTFGLVIDERRIAQYSGDELAEDAVRAALLAFGPPDVRRQPDLEHPERHDRN